MSRSLKALIARRRHARSAMKFAGWRESDLWSEIAELSREIGKKKRKAGIQPDPVPRDEKTGERLIKNPIFVRTKRVTIRRCFRNNDPKDVLRDDWFTTATYTGEDDPGAFNVRDLATFKGKPDNDAGRRAAIREGIAQDIVVPF